jgi:phage terminase large subunit-like protein
MCSLMARANTPTDWARRAVGLYHRLQPDRIVAQTNFAGDMAEATVRMVDQNIFFYGRHGIAW